MPDIAVEFLLSGQPIPDVPMGGAEGDDDPYGDEADDAGAGAAGLGQYNLPPETM